MRNIFKSIEEKTPTGLKLLIGGLVVASVALSTLILSSEEKDITASTVMITSLNGRSGGSGVVIDIGNSASSILTNRHVCEIALNGGGLVKTQTGESHLIRTISPSENHDLCLVTVAEKLNSKSKLADSSPIKFTESVVAGHPALMPLVFSKGHFSGVSIIEVFAGIRKCGEDELNNEKTLEVCLFFNGFPVIKTYEATLVTATIMPGSSGSAVYNNKNELSAVIFAGSTDFGYGWAVPYQYVLDFLKNEKKEVIKISYEMNIDNLIDKLLSKKRALIKKCSSIDEQKNDIIRKSCKVYTRDVLWRTINAEN